jgi:pimeloyl-ACP methyl ester carboxylesterase
MARMGSALALGSALFILVGTPAPAAPAPVDQAQWTSSKKQVRLTNGMRIAYIEAGNPSGEPLLLLHGYTDSSRTWSLLVPYLDKYRLLIPDQRGHGASDAPECCYGTSEFAYDARLFLDALGVKKAAVAGHSLGSLVAITMAAEYPDRVSRVVLIGSTALAPVKRGDWLFEQVAALKWPLDRQSEFLREWHPGNQPTPVDRAFADAAMEDILGVQPHVWRSVMRELAYVPAGRHAPDVKAPVLVLSGGKDPLFPPEHHAAVMKAFPQAQGRVFPQLGHNPLWERPQPIAEAMSRFLESTP